MKLISLIKITCFITAGIYLFGLGQDAYLNDLEPLDALGNIGMIFVLTEMGTIINQDKTTHKLSYKTLFLSNTMELTWIEKFALILGRLGMMLIILSCFYNFK
ncbi:hypothetical protein [Acinetobacter stercoris]|uniref:Uncharacterized protein n=1 Tax=Acinetobacter stercoris TaxID=2126983 RepID=A0A2U3N4Q3_9GAMM|nr:MULTISPECIES: hypothetical protein [Acinetobacter]SPL72555.1 hypothetical protein KPC_3733 [Acinetobacter stercoris]